MAGSTFFGTMRASRPAATCDHRPRRLGRHRCPTCGQQRDRGAVLILVALSMLALLAGTAMTVDLGRQMVARRDMQAVADMVALDMARLLDGQMTPPQLEGHPDWQPAANRAAQRNGYQAGDIGLVVEAGQWDEGTASFVRDVSRPANAVRANTSDTIGYFFMPGDGHANRRAIAMRGNDPSAAFQIGSFLVSLQPDSSSPVGRILNELLPGFSAVSWAGVVDGRVALGPLGEALGVDIPLTVGSTDEVLNTQVTLTQLITANITALQNSGGDTAAIQALQNLLPVAASANLPPIRLGDALGLDLSGGVPAGSLMLDSRELIMAAGLVAKTNASIADGQHLLDLTGTELGIGGGLLDVKVGLSVIEAPQIGGIHDGAMASTKQVGLTIHPSFDISVANLTGLVNACRFDDKDLANQDLLGMVAGLLGYTLGALKGLLNFLGINILDFLLSNCNPNQSKNQLPLDVSVTGSIPISLQLAQATGQQHIVCDANPPRLAVATDTGALRVRASGTLSADIRVGSTNLNLLQGHLRQEVATQSPSHHVFTFNAVNDGSEGPFKTFDPPALQSGSAPPSLSQSINVAIDYVDVVGVRLSYLTNIVNGVIRNLVPTLLNQVDNLVLQPLLQLLGLDLGGAQVRPLFMECDGGTKLVR